MAIFSPLPGSHAGLGRGPRQVPGCAVVATDPASVDADRDNGTSSMVPGYALPSWVGELLFRGPSA